LSEVIHSPIYATAVGLLLSGKQHLFDRRTDLPSQHGVKDLWGRMKNWFQGNF
jgi:cell division protein FtsA